MTKGTLAALLLLAPAGAFAFGSGDKGTTAAPFLQVGPGARAGAMGEAYSGVADDVDAVYYNPAGLGFQKKVEAEGMHDSLFQGINYEYAAISVPILRWTETRMEPNRYGVLGFSVYSLNVANIQRRGTTETDAAVDTFGATDFAYALSYGYQIPDTSLSLGATAKILDVNLDAAGARGFAADIGGLYRYEQWSIGLGLRDFGTLQKLNTAADPLPLTFFSGVGYRVTPRVLASFDLSLPRNNNALAAVGAEYRHPFGDNLNGSLRAGYNMRNNRSGGLSGGSFGLGVGYYNFDFDFAWVPFGDLGNTFRYALRVKF